MSEPEPGRPRAASDAGVTMDLYEEEIRLVRYNPAAQTGCVDSMEQALGTRLPGERLQRVIPAQAYDVAQELVVGHEYRQIVVGYSWPVLVFARAPEVPKQTEYVKGLYGDAEVLK